MAGSLTDPRMKGLGSIMLSNIIIIIIYYQSGVDQNFKIMCLPI
jgi:hypothetical protein